MESTNICQIKAALWDQAFIGYMGQLSNGAFGCLVEERDNFWR
jgi:hypothetical protein